MYTSVIPWLLTWLWHIQAPYIPCTKSRVPFALLRLYQRISPGLRHFYPFCNKACFYDEELLTPRPTPKLEDTPCRLSATAYSIYLQLLSILEVIPSSGTWGRTMLWWQGHGPPSNNTYTIFVYLLIKHRWSKILCVQRQMTSQHTIVLWHL